MASEYGNRSTLGEQQDLFLPIAGDLSIKNQTDLMERPFFSLAKQRRTKPIEYQVGDNYVHVTSAPEFGIATIWDADILMWVASQIKEAQKLGLPTSRHFRVASYDVLRFIGRGTSGKHYREFKRSLQRLQSTVITTNIRQHDTKKLHQFSWINEWKEVTDANGKSRGIEFIIPDWLYEGIFDNNLTLTMDKEYFKISGGIERWLYRVCRKHGGFQRRGWAFSFRQLYEKSGSSDRFSNFVGKLRAIVNAQGIPHYWLEFETGDSGETGIRFTRRDSMPAWRSHSNTPAA